jgi:fructoselysine-6-P-deglycase FrlB-like protein
VPYKRSQIKQLNAENEKFTKINKTDKEKTKIQKFKKLYSRPKSIPNEIKTHIAKRIEEKKEEIVNFYHEPKSVVTLGKAGRWTVAQLVKAFLGMPIIPGR